MQLSCLSQPNGCTDDPTILNIFCLISLSLIVKNKKKLKCHDCFDITSVLE